jgi:hypothetical protein
MKVCVKLERSPISTHNFGAYSNFNQDFILLLKPALNNKICDNSANRTQQANSSTGVCITVVTALVHHFPLITQITNFEPQYTL